MITIDLYEDNAGGLYLQRDGGRLWSLGVIGLDAQFRGKFGEDAAAWIAGDWEPGEASGQTEIDDETAVVDHVATWENGAVTLSRINGYLAAGFSAQGYLGITDDN